MPHVKLTLKQETFCKAYIETGNASEAYRRVYSCGKMKDETIHRSAKELMDNPKIATRIVGIQAHHMERHEVTVDSLTTELEEARSLAVKIEAPAPMVAATMGKARLHGLGVEKKELSGPNGGPIPVEDVPGDATIEAARRIAYALNNALTQKDQKT